MILRPSLVRILRGEKLLKTSAAPNQASAVSTRSMLAQATEYVRSRLTTTTPRSETTHRIRTMHASHTAAQSPPKSPQKSSGLGSASEMAKATGKTTTNDVALATTITEGHDRRVTGITREIDLTGQSLEMRR